MKLDNMSLLCTYDMELIEKEMKGRLEYRGPLEGYKRLPDSYSISVSVCEITQAADKKMVGDIEVDVWLDPNDSDVMNRVYGDGNEKHDGIIFNASLGNHGYIKSIKHGDVNLYQLIPIEDQSLILDFIKYEITRKLIKNFNLERKYDDTAESQFMKILDEQIALQTDKVCKANIRWLKAKKLFKDNPSRWKLASPQLIRAYEKEGIIKEEEEQMGMYTEAIIGCRLREDTPEKVIEVLDTIVNDNKDHDRLGDGYKNEFEEVGVDHDKFKRFDKVLRCESYYFGVYESHAIFKKDKFSDSYFLDSRSSCKNYHGEIEEFLKWLRPYIDGGSGRNDVYALTMYEEDSEYKVWELHNPDDDALEPLLYLRK